MVRTGICSYVIAVPGLLLGSAVAVLWALLGGCAVAAGAPRIALGCAAAALMSLGGPALPWFRPGRGRRVAAGIVAFAAATVLVLAAPWPMDEGARLAGAVVLDGQPAGAPLFRFIPERELVRCGAWLGLFPAERHWLDEGLFERSYDAIAREGWVDPGASRVLDAWLLDRGHLWLARPEGPGPFPLLVFLHGFGGPFQFYPQALANEATSRGLVLALPSWGFAGHWSSPAGQRRIAETVEAVARACPIDRRRIYLGGLSAGGFGAVDAFACDDAGRFAACAAISGASPDPPLGEPAFQGRPLLLVHGARDVRVDVSCSRRLAEAVRRHGGRVVLDERPRGDHFIMLTESDVVPTMLAWLLEQRGR